MKKQDAIINLSTIFNRGSSTDRAATSFFAKKDHDTIINLLQNYIQNSHALIGNPKITKSQSLNDHGVDMILEYPNTAKIGIQIKCPSDVKADDFSLKVKSQMAESQYHGVDKWYLFICAPLSTGTGKKKKDFSYKIGHLINELSSYKTTYHIVYSPQQACNILTKAVMTDNEYHAIRNQFFFEPVDWMQLLQEIKSDKKSESYLSGIETAKETKSLTAKLYSDYIGYTEKDEMDSNIEYLEDLQTLLKKLTTPTREFLYAVLERANKKDPMRGKILASCQDLENYINISKYNMRNEIAILDELGIAEFDDERENGIDYIAINRTNRDYNILEDIKKFCVKKNKPLKDIIVNLNFSHFDN